MPSTVLDYTLSNTPPAGITPIVGGSAPSNTEPEGVELAMSPTGSGADDVDIISAPTSDQPAAIDIGAGPTDAAAAPIDLVGAQSSLRSMPSTFIPAFVGLTGGGLSLATLTANAADAASNRILQGIVNGELKSYRIRAGTDAQQLPGIVRLANFDADSNPVVAEALDVSQRAPVTLAYAATLNTNAAAGATFDVTLTGNVTLANPSNPADGLALKWRIRQDATGGRAVALGDKFRLPASASPLAWSTEPESLDVLAAIYDEAADKWDVVSFVPGYLA